MHVIPHAPGAHVASAIVHRHVSHVPGIHGHGARVIVHGRGIPSPHAAIHGHVAHVAVVIVVDHIAVVRTHGRPHGLHHPAHHASHAAHGAHGASTHGHSTALGEGHRQD